MARNNRRCLHDRNRGYRLYSPAEHFCPVQLEKHVTCHVIGWIQGQDAISEFPLEGRVLFNHTCQQDQRIDVIWIGFELLLTRLARMSWEKEFARVMAGTLFYVDWYVAPTLSRLMHLSK